MLQINSIQSKPHTTLNPSNITFTLSGRAYPDNEGVLSITRLAIDRTKLENLLTSTLSDHVLSLGADSSQGKVKDNNVLIFDYTDEHDIILFLPPHYHILLKCISDDSSTVVKIACDNWMLLPFLGEWLKSLL